MSSIFLTEKSETVFGLSDSASFLHAGAPSAAGVLLSIFPDERAESIILAAEIILPYLSTVMKGIADIKSTIPHFQNPILSAADKYLHATSIRKNTHAAKSASLNILQLQSPPQIYADTQAPPPQRPSKTI